MHRRSLSLTSLLVAAIMFVLGGLLTTSGLSAQGTPEAQGDADVIAHPAHIHAGTCQDLGDVVYPLEDVSTGSVGAAPVASPDVMGTPMAEETAETGMSGTPMPTSAAQGQIHAMSTTDVEASLDDILGAEHAINVHESAENIQNYIACGDITGEATDGMLSIELQELNGSGFSGEAVLVDNGDGTTTVTVTLFSSADGMTDSATPAS